MNLLANVTIGVFIQRDSFIHKLNPSIKILTVIVFMILFFSLSNGYSYALCGIYLSFFLYLSKIPVKFFLRGLKPLMFLFMFTFFLHIFVTDGIEMYSYGIFSITYEGVESGFDILFRLGFIVILVSLLTLTTSPIELADALEFLLGPLKRFNVPVHEFAMMITISLRFIPTLASEIDKIMTAQMARGVEFDNGPLLKRLQAFIPILIPLFINSFKRAEELAVAMEVRCYQGGEGRTSYREYKIKGVDYLSVFFTLVMIFGIITLR